MYVLMTRALSSSPTGEQLVDDYANMEAGLTTAPFAFGAIPNFRTDLEFEVDLNIAAFITSPPQPSSPFNSSSQTTPAEAVVVSILKRNDRLRALEACLDDKSLVDVRVDDCCMDIYTTITTKSQH